MPIDVGSFQRLAGAVAACKTSSHPLQSVQAGFGEGIGLEDDVEPRDVIAVVASRPA